MRGRPFKKGQSGNPGGRPRVVGDIQELAREKTAKAMETLASIMDDPKQPGAARVSAARELLDRGYGKPPQYLTQESLVTKLAEDMTDDELATIAAGANPFSGTAVPASNGPSPRTRLGPGTH